ncbi:MAG TPA: hypothetical protein VFP12_13785 [Allosphingosinicella sp.]|nr:hypothetical protein [Allosphingosinicella sp.]
MNEISVDDWIDVWDVDTFDTELRTLLDDHSELIRSYWRESSRLFMEREAQTLRGPPEENIHGGAYVRLKERLGGLMERRTIRAWHFTRLTEQEVESIRLAGMQPMSLDLIQHRLAAVVGEGLLHRHDSEALYATSPFHDRLADGRSARIWLAATPYPIDDSGVRELLELWGGESVSFIHRQGRLHELLRTIGRPRILEIALPLAATTRAFSAGENVLDHYSFRLGCTGGWGGGADIVAVEPIRPDWILKVHSAGDPSFEAMARGYPERFTGVEG